MLDSCHRAPRTLAFRTARVLTIASASSFTALHRQGNKTPSTLASAGKDFLVGRPDDGNLPWIVATLVQNGGNVMSPMSRRSIITTAAGGLLTATTAAMAQTGEETPQPRRAGHGGSDPGPRNLMRDRQNP